MPGSRSAGWLLVGAFGALLFSCRDAPAPAPTRPNILLVTIDTLRADHLGSYGYADADTPNLDAFAADGVRFDAAFAPIPRTTPALASLMTGLPPKEHGSREVFQKIESGTMLAELLSASGYDTLGLSANPAAGERQGFARGFRLFLLQGKHAGVVTASALRLLRLRLADRPLFLWVHYVDPHWPYRPPDLDPERGRRCRALRRAKVFYTNRKGRARLALDQCTRLYDAEIAFVDQELKPLFSALKTVPGEWLEVVTSDHGENLGEDGLFYAHGPSVAHASARVPLMVRGAGIDRAGVDHRLVGVRDLWATVLDSAGVAEEKRPKADSISILSAAETDRSTRTHIPLESAGALRAVADDLLIFTGGGRLELPHCVHDSGYSLCWGKKHPEERFYHHEKDMLFERPITDVPEAVKARLMIGRRTWTPSNGRRRAVTTLTHKLVEIPVVTGGYRRELYALPDETRNIAAEEPELARQLGANLELFTRGLPSYVPSEHTEEELKALRDLGYID